MGVLSAREGRDTLVMTFDPSMRLKQALGVGEEARLREMPVALRRPGHPPRQPARRPPDLRPADRALRAGRGVPPPRARQPLLPAPLGHASGGILEYMAVERLFEVAADGRYGQVVLDTPPTRQALDFLEAPARIVGFLDSGALRVALKPWFDEEGRLKAASTLGAARPAGRALPRRGGGHGPAARHGRVLPGLRRRSTRGSATGRGRWRRCCARRRPSSSWSPAPGRSAFRTPSSSPASWRRPATTSARSW